MKKEDKKVFRNILQAHGETLTDVYYCLKSRNENMLCGIYGNISGGLDDVLETLQEFNIFFETKKAALVFFKDQFFDCGYDKDTCIFEYLKESCKDLIKTNDGYVLPLYY